MFQAFILRSFRNGVFGSCSRIRSLVATPQTSESDFVHLVDDSPGALWVLDRVGPQPRRSVRGASADYIFVINMGFMDFLNRIFLFCYFLGFVSFCHLIYGVFFVVTSSLATNPPHLRQGPALEYLDRAVQWAEECDLEVPETPWIHVGWWFPM